MFRDDAIALMKIELGFRKDKTDDLVTALKASQELLELAPTKPWFLLSEGATIRTTPNERRVHVPVDFIAEYEDGALRYLPDDATKDSVILLKFEREHLEKTYARTAVGPPKAYAKVGDYFELWPLPDDDYLLEMRYYYKDEALDSNIENRWLKNIPYLLMGHAGQTIAEGLRDGDAMKSFLKWEREARMVLHGQNEELMHDNMRYQMGGAI